MTLPEVLQIVLAVLGALLTLAVLIATWALRGFTSTLKHLEQKIIAIEKLLGNGHRGVFPRFAEMENAIDKADDKVRHDIRGEFHVKINEVERFLNGRIDHLARDRRGNGG